MITLHVRDIFPRANIWLSDGGADLHVVRDNEVVFYVGQSIEPILRLHDHLGMGSRTGMPSDLGTVIRDNLPLSLDWQIDLLHHTECGPYVAPHIKCVDIHAAERALIAHYRPCLNTMHNYEPTPLPDRYRNAEKEAAIRAACIAAVERVFVPNIAPAVPIQAPKAARRRTRGQHDE